MKCERCNGSGYQTAAKEMGMEDYPKMQRPLGIWRCDYCGGTGERTDYAALFAKMREENPEEWAKFDRRMTRLVKKFRPERKQANDNGMDINSNDVWVHK